MSTTRRTRPRKIVLAGDKDTGKHCYVRRLIDNKYPRDSWTNNEYDIWSYNYQLDENTAVNTEICIIHGAERGKSALKKHYKNIDGYIIMFDVTNPESYDNVVGWKKIIDAENKLHDLPCILLATKCDLDKDPELADQMKAIDIFIDLLHFRAHFEISSRDSINVQESFEYLIREILGDQNARPSSFDRAESVSQTEVNPSISQRDSSPSATPTNGLSRSPSATPTRFEQQEHRLKIVITGQIGTGKSAILQRYVKNTFTNSYVTTIGTDIGYKKFVYNRDILNIQIWDVAGAERFGGMTHLFYRDADACMVVFDVSKYSTLNEAVKWKEDFDLKVNYDEEARKPCLLVGNKCDLDKDGQIQDKTHVEEFCKYHKFIRYFETSAKANVSIAECFHYLITEIMAQRLGEQGRERFSSRGIVNINSAIKSSNKNFSGCC